MKRETLEKKLKECKEQLKNNSKDAHFAENLIDKMLSYKGQLGVEPTLLDCGKKENEWVGKTFVITKTNKGVLYHAFGGYSIFVTPNNKALYETLCDYVDNQEEYEKFDDELKEKFELNLSAIIYVLNTPLFAFNDVDFTYKIACEIIDYLKSTFDKLMNEPLQEEDVEKDDDFKQATLGLDALKDAIEEEEKQGNSL